MNGVSIHLKNTLRSLRVKFGYTQGEAAILLEVSIPTLRAWECNSGGVPYQKILKIEEVYNTSQDYIFFGNEDSFSELVRKPALKRRKLMKKKTNLCAFCKDHKVVKFGGTWICTKCAGKLFKRKNQPSSGVG